MKRVYIEFEARKAHVVMEAGAKPDGLIRALDAAGFPGSKVRGPDNP